MERKTVGTAVKKMNVRVSDGIPHLSDLFLGEDLK